MQKLITLIIGVAMLYTIFQHKANSIPEQNVIPLQKEAVSEKSAKVEPEFSGNFVEKTLSNVVGNVLKTENGRRFIENMIQPMNKVVAGEGAAFEMNNNNFINAIFSINTVGEGKKGPASCGQTVEVQYKILDSSDVVLNEKTATFALGSNKLMPGMDAVIIGMKTGQTRDATIINKYIQGNKDTVANALKINVTLQNIMSENFIGEEVKIFDDQLAHRIPLVCGNRAIFNAKITRLTDGKVLYNSADSNQKINIIIGDSNYPAIFSYALHNKVPVGTRTVLTPGKFFKSYSSKNNMIFPNTVISEDEYLMIEFFDFDSKILTDSVTYTNIQ
ncbi:MAG: FKBP-type peptidyl-prolyl cis-trans isomerase [Rickettsiaceae bacterium]|nr:FKBP-type peptidyl-prolyl cis-trans isomerase [Rickettsiaceae bacterium]